MGNEKHEQEADVAESEDHESEHIFSLGNQRRARVEDNNLIIETVEDGAEVCRLMGYEAPLSYADQLKVNLGRRVYDTAFHSVAVNSSFTRIVAGTTDSMEQEHAVRLWDTSVCPIRSGLDREIGRIKLDAAIHSISIDKTGRRVAMLSNDGVLQLRWLMPPQSDLPSWFADFLELYAKTRIDPIRGPRALFKEEMFNISRALDSELRSKNTSDYMKVLRWGLTRGSNRTLDPFTNLTFREAANRILGWESPDPQLAYRYDCTHPLVHLFLAAESSDEFAARVLRQYGVERLPKEAAVCIRAAKILIEQDERALARVAIEKAAALEPSNTEIARLRESIN
jgi:hypothetical protein